jgi:hypothetical protein
MTHVEEFRPGALTFEGSQEPPVAQDAGGIRGVNVESQRQFASGTFPKTQTQAGRAEHQGPARWAGGGADA